MHDRLAAVIACLLFAALAAVYLVARLVRWRRAVRAADALVDGLAAGTGPMTADHVTAVLAAWRAEVDATPLPKLPDPDTAARLIRDAPPTA